MELKTTDKLAIERTRLANERTFLAYFRSTIVFLSSGFAIVKLEMLQEIEWVGFALIAIGPILFFIGFIRFIYVKRSIRKFYK
jgi:putative membrane protein